MNIGIEIIWDNGDKEWIDPVDEEEFIRNHESSTHYFISNGLYTYEYPKDRVMLKEYGLSDCCVSDARSTHTHKCSMKEII